MDKLALEPMQKYMGTSPKKLVVVLAVLAALGAALYFSMDGDAQLGVLIVFGVLFVVILAACVWTELKIKLMFQRFEKKGELDALIADFEKSVPVAGDIIRMGEKYCYGKGGSTAVAYGDITKVVHFCQITNGVVNERSLRYDTKEKENRVLCSLPKLAGYESAFSEVCMELLKRNPGIRIG